MSDRIIFDSLTGSLEDFVSERFQEIKVLDLEIRALVFNPLVTVADQQVSQTRSIKLLDECFKLAEDEFSHIAARLSLDSWMSVIRRFPRSAGFSVSCIVYITLGLIRYSARNVDTTLGKTQNERQFGLALAYTEDDLFDTFRLASLARTLEEIAGTRRWIGKGAKLLPSVQRPINIEVPDEVQVSVSEYERRRPSSSILQDEGLLAAKSVTASAVHLIVLARPRVEYIYVPGRNISLLIRYFPTVLDIEPILKQLCAYEDAIEDIFSVTPHEIVHFFAALAAQILNSLPVMDRITDKAIVLSADDGSVNYDHSLGFLYGICHRGYLRFPREAMMARLEEVRSPWVADSSSAKIAITRFLKAFLIGGDGNRDSLDLTTLRPYPLVYTSASGEVYLDLLAPLDFFASLFVRAREWYSTQHGDRFTLSLKKLIETQTNATVVDWKVVMKNASGKDCEVDLLVLQFGKIFAIECKAFAKSPAFLRGDPDAVAQRSARIKEATDQAQVAANAVRDAVAHGDSTLPAGAEVEWLVCTPTQEYLRPFGRFGFVAGTIPRVCTPEELVSVLNGKPPDS